MLVITEVPRVGYLDQEASLVPRVLCLIRLQKPWVKSLMGLEGFLHGAVLKEGFS